MGYGGIRSRRFREKDGQDLIKGRKNRGTESDKEQRPRTTSKKQDSYSPTLLKDPVRLAGG